jgi:CHAD domain-containing protein
MSDTKKKKVIQSLGDIPDHIANMEDEVYTEMIKCIKDNLSPEDVFDQKQLEKWAEKNGYVQDMSDMEW